MHCGATACTALIRRSTNNGKSPKIRLDQRILEIFTVLRPPHYTGHAVIVALRHAQRPVLAPEVRVLSRLDVSRRSVR